MASVALVRRDPDEYHVSEGEEIKAICWDEELAHKIKILIATDPDHIADLHKEDDRG